MAEISPDPRDTVAYGVDSEAQTFVGLYISANFLASTRDEILF